MRKHAFLAVVVASLAAVAPAATADQVITINPAGFVPRNVTVNVGERVTWTNADTRSHQVVVERTSCNLTISPAATGACTFRVAGRFPYREPSRSGGAWRGAVTVRAVPRAVTIAARPSTVTYNAATTLSGTVSSAQANEQVMVRGQTCGTTTFAAVATATTTTGGAWTLPARPLKNTVYQASWRGASSAVAVTVRPRLTLRKLTRRRLAVRVLAAQSFAGKLVVFQRYNARARAWSRVRFVVLRRMGGTAPTVISGANFRSTLRAGTRIRVVMSATQAGGCYAASTSNVIRR